MKIGFIGAGKMAEAMISAFIASKKAGPHEIFASDIREERRKEVKQRYGVNMYSKNSVVPGMSDVVVLSVKPQDLDTVLAELAPGITAGHLVISIVAGKKTGYIESFFPMARIVRVMPNLACTVSEGMSVFCAGKKASPADKDTATELLSSFGKVLELPEEQFDAVTALSGSGPAFFAWLMDRMVDAAVNQGLDRKNALLLAEQTMLGASKLLLEKEIDPQDLIKSVASPKGTTAAGLAILEESDVPEVLRRTLEAASNRSRELSS